MTEAFNLTPSHLPLHDPMIQSIILYDTGSTRAAVLCIKRKNVFTHPDPCSVQIGFLAIAFLVMFLCICRVYRYFLYIQRNISFVDPNYCLRFCVGPFQYSIKSENVRICWYWTDSKCARKKKHIVKRCHGWMPETKMWVLFRRNIKHVDKAFVQVPTRCCH